MNDVGSEPSIVPSFHRSGVLVIQTAFLGDVVLTTPLLSALARRHGAVDVVATTAAASLLETHPAVASVIRYDKHGSARGWVGFRKLAAQMRARRYAAVYLPHRSVRSAALALWSGAPERIGFADAPAAITYTSRIPRPSTGHEVERLLALAGPGQASPPVALELTAADQAQAEAWLAAHGVRGGFVALAPGSIWGTKRWPYYRELAGVLTTTLVIVGGEDDAPLARDIITAAPGRVFSAAGALTLRASAALIQRATALVTNDSAPLHLATAVGTPIVAVFGPTVPEFGFGPRRPGDIVLGHAGLACRPCSKHGPRACPLGHHRCMRELSVETVAAAVMTAARMEEPGEICPRN
ncbi:MAG TPA: lipopolysaccharide heptosyltransferase II [Gemmatimonadales bacterium]|nr:lipopolysaccharide heptosyltransferase II [Gemmatimonadales bacterium]